MTSSLIQQLADLAKCMRQRRRVQLALLLGLMLASAVAEVVSLGAILPFLVILVDPSQALKTPLVAGVISVLSLDTGGDLRWRLTLLFSLTAVGAGIMRFALIYATVRLSYRIGHEIGAEVFRRTLHQPYEVHVARNSSEIVGGISKVDQVVSVVFSVLTVVSGSLMAMFIVIVLVLIDPLLATVTLLGLGGIYMAVSVVAQNRLSNNSLTMSEAITNRTQVIQEGLGGIRDILLDHTQVLFERRYNKSDWAFRQAQASINIVGPSPRFAVEALGMVLIAVLAYAAATTAGGLAPAIPAFGALALGAQRLMPLVQQIYLGWVQAAGNRQVMSDVLDLLKQPIPDEVEIEHEPLPFEHEIRFERVSFKYQPHLPLVLKEISLGIPKGARVGFVGATGSGKSTLMDLLMGLLQPSEGQISVDGRSMLGAARQVWQRNIAHVPQAIFLTDASFTENIAFGVRPDHVDMERVRQVARQAQISEFIEANPQGYQATVGERGVRLSGGQRQRIGIARALYKQAAVLVFDEATSALDGETEAAVMSSIFALGRGVTILIIAHRVSTLKDCDAVFEITRGSVV